MGADLGEWFRGKVLNLDRMMTGQLTLVVPPVIVASTVGELLEQTNTQTQIRPTNLAVLISSQIIGAGISQTPNAASLFQIQPGGLNPMPSVGVFIKLMQHYTEVQSIVVATQWGLWVLINRYDKPSLYLSTSDMVLRQEIQTSLDQVETSRFKIGNGAIKAYSQLSSDNVDVIRQTIRTISDITNIQMSFYDWDKLLSIAASSTYAVRIPVPLYDVIPTRLLV
jgi:hypothetical protein